MQPNISVDSPTDQQQQQQSPTTASSSNNFLHPSSSILSQQQPSTTASSTTATATSSTTSASTATSSTTNKDLQDSFPSVNSNQRITSARRKIPLAPNHSPLDWARLKSSGTNLRGVAQLSRISLSDLSTHNKRDDVWIAFNGKVYNATQYIHFHPGGSAQLMRGAGKDATDLILKVHPWVNVDLLLDQCLVGYLVKSDVLSPAAAMSGKK